MRRGGLGAVLLKRGLVPVLVGCLLFIGLLAPPAARAADIRLIVNGQEIYSDVPPSIINERVLVPLRAVGEAIGTYVEWNPAYQVASLGTHVRRADGWAWVRVFFQIGDQTGLRVVASLDGSFKEEAFDLDAPPLTLGGRTLLPLRAAAEAIGATVTWNQQLRTVEIATPEPEPNVTSITYTWTHRGFDYTWTLPIPDLRAILDGYRNLPHPRGYAGYTTYTTDPYDNEWINWLITQLEEKAKKDGFSRVEFVVSFVQGLPYTSDSASTPFDDYPRYPMETLFDKGGDCEDTAILTAVLLREMGYGTALIFTQGQDVVHAAVGVWGGEEISGTYYSLNGRKYFYLETTASDWPLGVVPAEYRNARAVVVPLPWAPAFCKVRKAGGTRSGFFYLNATITESLQ